MIWNLPLYQKYPWLKMRASNFEACPVCKGKGVVDKPPWVDDDSDSWVDCQTGRIYPCKACKNTGVLER